MTSSQMEAFRVDQEPEAMRERYGNDGLGRSCLMARRLVEAGARFVTMTYGGWDHHDNIDRAMRGQVPALEGPFGSIQPFLNAVAHEDVWVVIHVELGAKAESVGKEGSQGY